MILIALPDIATEDRLLARARQGDRGAVTEIYEVYFEPVYHFIRLRVDDPALAEDLTSEVFVRLVGALRGWRAPRHSLRGWLFRVARNLLHDHYGQHKGVSLTALDETLDGWAAVPAEDGPEAQVAARLDAERVRQVIRTLPPEQQEVLLLRFGQMLSLQETADIMGKRVGAVKSLQYRATSALRERLGQMVDGSRP